MISSTASSTRAAWSFSARAAPGPSGPLIVKDQPGPALDGKDIKEQGKSVYHSPRKIMDGLGFRHVYNYRQGMATVRKWRELANLARPERADCQRPVTLPWAL
jgi:hypothetical protein